MEVKEFCADAVNNCDYQLVYLGFDGASTVYNNDELDFSLNVSIMNSGLTAVRQQSILQLLSEKYNNQGVYFTLDKPVGTQLYSTVYIGESNDFAQYGSFAGLAETIDKGNAIHNDNAFVFADKEDSDEEIFSIIDHELGHIVSGKEHNVTAGTLQDYALNWYNEERRLDELYNNLQKTAPDLGIQSSSFVYSGSTMGPRDADYICFTSGITGTITISQYPSAFVSNTEVYYNSSLYGPRATPYENLKVSVTKGNKYYFEISNYNLYQTSEFYYWQFSFSGSGGNVVTKEKADLYVKTHSLSSSQVTPQQSCTLNFTVHNAGKGSAAASTAYIYAGSYKLGSVEIPALSAGYSYDASYRINAGTLAVGTHNLKIKLDAENEVGETNGENNYAYRTLVVTGAANLWVKNFSVNSSTVLSNQAIKLSFTVANAGNIAAGSSVAYIYANSLKLGQVSVSSISAGGAVTYSYTIAANKLAAGTHNLRVQVDADNRIAESYENNNNSYRQVTIKRAAANLWVKNFSVSSNTIMTNQVLKLSFTVANAGNIAAGSSVAYIYANSLKLGQVSVSTISANGTATYSYTIAANKLAAGKHTIRVQVDATNRISESYENNNNSYQSVTFVKPAANLWVKNFTVSSKNTATNQALKLSFTVANAGNIAAGASVAYIYANSFKLGQVSVGTISANGTATYSYTIATNKLAAGTHTLRVQVDATNRIAESYENNNNSYQSVVFRKPMVNLTVKNSRLSTVQATTDEPVKYTFTVTNAGEIAVAASTAYIYSHSVKIGEVSIKSLAAGESVTCDYTITANKLAAGNHKISVKVDGANRLAESNENDNSSDVSSLTVKKSAPDLEITNLSLPAEYVSSTQDTVIYFTVKNSGNCTAAASSVCFYAAEVVFDPTKAGSNGYFRRGTLLGSMRIGALEAGRSVSYAYTFQAGTLELGETKLLLEADGTFEIAEPVEVPASQDNKRYNNFSEIKTLTVVDYDLPDLVISNVDVQTVYVGGSKNLSIELTVENTGEGIAAPVDLDVFSQSDSMEITLLKSLETGYLTAGATEVITLNIAADKLFAGGQELTFRLDIFDELAESNENNNSVIYYYNHTLVDYVDNMSTGGMIATLA